MLITGDAHLRAYLTEASRCRAGRPSGASTGATRFEEVAELDVRRVQDLWIPLSGWSAGGDRAGSFRRYLPPLNPQVQRNVGLVTAGDW